MADLPSGTVTFHFTAIAGSTTGWEANRPTMAAVVAEHLALLDVRTSRVSYGRMG